MSRGHPLHLVLVMEHSGDALDLSIWLLDLVHSAEQNVDMRINRGRLLNDVLHARVRDYIQYWDIEAVSGIILAGIIHVPWRAVQAGAVRSGTVLSRILFFQSGFTTAGLKSYYLRADCFVSGPCRY